MKDVAVEIAKNLAMSFSFIRNRRLARSRTSEGSPHGPQALDHHVFGLLREVTNAREKIDGLHVTEIGPGDHVATGLAFLAAGAASYTCIDRFPGPYGSEYAKGWYRAVQAAWPMHFPEIPWPGWLEADTFPDTYPDKVRVIPVGVENIKDLPRCDIICSHVVGEHVQDLESFARISSQALEPGGVAVHVVDFSQHYDWNYFGDPFLFLRFPDWLWNLMGSNRGLPNRFRYHEFVAAFEAVGLRVQCYDRVIAPELANPESLAQRFRGMPADSIKTLRASFICVKEG